MPARSLHLGLLALTLLLPVAARAATVTVASPQVRAAAASNAPQLGVADPTLGETAPPPPFSLTCPDGAGLLLRRVEVRAVVQGPLAWTELWLTFHNPEDRVREGRFTVTLPPDAALGRFAMQVDELWLDGEVVERAKAERVYEDFLHARQDPAILTKDAGNVFSARVFPIGAKADKRLVLAYSQPLADPGRPLELPLRGLPQVGELVVKAWLGLRDGAVQQVADVALVNVLPQRDLRIWPAAADSSGDAVRAGKTVVARLTVVEAAARAAFDKVLILFDTSASAAPDLAGRLQVLQQVVALVAGAGGSEVVVVAFDQTRQTIYRGPPAGFGPSHVAALQARAALGASDPGAALVEAAALAGSGWRLILVSDAMATAGATTAKALQTLVKKLAKSGLQRLDVVLPPGARDEAMATALASAGLPQPGAVVRSGRTTWFPRSWLA